MGDRNKVDPNVIRAKSEEEALELVFKDYMPLLLNVARRFNLSGLIGVSMNDLLQEGKIGLMKAVKRFDPNKGTSFGSYARLWVHGEMSDFVSRHGVAIPLSRRDQKIKQAQLCLELEGELPIKYGDIAEEELNRQLPTVQLKDLYDDGGDHLYVVEDFSDNVVHSIMIQEEFEEIHALMQRILTPLEKSVLFEYCGFNKQNHPETYAVIGAKIGYTPEGVRQIKKRAVEKIHIALEKGF